MSHYDIDDSIDELDRPAGAVAETPVRTVPRVVLIFHGIRDNGLRTRRIEREIRTTGRGRALVIVIRRIVRFR